MRARLQRGSPVELPGTRAVSSALYEWLKNRGKPAHPTDAYKALAHHFNLTDLQLHAERISPGGKRENAWANRVRTARKTLVERSLVRTDEEGLWTVTERRIIPLEI